MTPLAAVLSVIARSDCTVLPETNIGGEADIEDRRLYGLMESPDPGSHAHSLQHPGHPDEPSQGFLADICVHSFTHDVIWSSEAAGPDNPGSRYSDQQYPPIVDVARRPPTQGLGGRALALPFSQLSVPLAGTRKWTTPGGPRWVVQHTCRVGVEVQTFMLSLGGG